jgi:lactoylglutathione lyase
MGDSSGGQRMIINHINLTVTDPEAAANFLHKYFGLTIYPDGDSKFMAVTDDNGMIVTLMKAGQVKYPATFHIGFGQPGREQVNAIHQRLVEDGFNPPAPEQHHAWTFYVEAPGGFTVEVMA